MAIRIGSAGWEEVKGLRPSKWQLTVGSVGRRRRAEHLSPCVSCQSSKWKLTIGSFGKRRCAERLPPCVCYRNSWTLSHDNYCQCSHYEPDFLCRWYGLVSRVRAVHQLSLSHVEEHSTATYVSVAKEFVLNSTKIRTRTKRLYLNGERKKRIRYAPLNRFFEAWMNEF